MPEFPVEVIIKLIDQISSTTSQVKSSLATVDGSLKETEKNTSSLQQAFSTAAGVMLRDFVQSAVTSAINSLKRASDTFAEFELTVTKTVSATGASGEAAVELAQSFNSLSLAQEELGFSGREAAGALEALVKAGMDGKQAASALRSALSLARIEGLSTERASALLVQTLTMFNLTAEQSADALDSISRAADAGIGTAEDYASGLSNCGAAAFNMGLSLEETLSALVMLDKTFGSAVESGTYLNSMFKDLIAKSDDLGLELYNADGSMRGLDEIVQQLRSNVAAFGDDQQAVNEYLSVFDIRAQRAVMGLLNYEGSLADVQVQMDGARDVQDKVNMVMETGAGKMATLEAALENANYDLGAMTLEVELMWKQYALSLGPVGGLVDALGPTMLQGAITGVMMIMPQLIQQHKSLAVAATAAIGAFTATYSIINMLPEPYRQTASVVAVVTGAFVAATVAVAAFYGVLSWGTAVPAIIAGIATSVAGVTALLGGLTEQTDAYVASNSRLEGSLDGLSGSLDVYTEKLNGLSSAYSQSINDEQAAYRESVDALRQSYTDRYGTTVNEQSRLEDEVNRYYDGLASAAKRGYDECLTAGQTYFDDLWGITEGNLSDLESYVNEHYDRLVSDAYEGYQQQLTAGEQYFADLWGVTAEQYGSIEEYVNSHYRDELSLLQQNNSSKLSENRSYYDSLIADTRDKLSELQAANAQELDDLEIEYLTKKKEIEDEYSVETKAGRVVSVGSVGYQHDMAALEEWYKTQKQTLTERSRLEELTLEKEVNSEITELIEQRNASELELVAEQNAALAALEEQKKADLETALKLQLEAEAAYTLELQRLETQRTADLEVAQQYLLQAQADFNAEMASIEAQRLADLSSAQAEIERLTAEHHARLIQLEKEFLAEQQVVEGQREAAAVPVETWIRGDAPTDTWSRIVAPAETWYRDDLPAHVTPWTAGESSSGFDSAKNLIDEMLTKAKAKQIFSSIPHLAEGGFVSEPTLALVGEAGPEVVLPVNRFNNRAGDVYNISVPIHVQGSVDERVLRLMRKELESVLIESTSTGGKTKRIRRGGIF